ncbi:uncharacterized protein EV422DRAFT_504586 [Fimicolochytrium jonesii]|uniref:uncharacterized protein n=1 Tax=Fimicolochytrium jonesii TaxID=1396493 RepID=UPI0022FE4ED4|nr:uncharacterized protein EV422DRAFT_504586 [Fimicolochytrium jonesii]KAI8823368.1 hypothetical protein EV422DRAFT_504586 [Fimicolochytrium jonesii]
MVANVVNDGAVILKRQKARTRKFSDVRGIVVMFIEAKRLKHDMTPGERYGQLAGEALWTAQHNLEGVGSGDQEVFGVVKTHRNAHIFHGVFKESYLRNAPSALSPNDSATLKISRSFDLANTGERLEFVAQLLGVLHYVKSGNSFVGKMRGAGLPVRI